jgi:hypothetical protein
MPCELTKRDTSRTAVDLAWLGRGRHGLSGNSHEPRRFSWRRLRGISAGKARSSRSIGIPLTKSGREQNSARIVTGRGCLLPLFVRVFAFALVIRFVV